MTPVQLPRVNSLCFCVAHCLDTHTHGQSLGREDGKSTCLFCALWAVSQPGVIRGCEIIIQVYAMFWELQGRSFYNIKFEEAFGGERCDPITECVLTLLFLFVCLHFVTCLNRLDLLERAFDTVVFLFPSTSVTRLSKYLTYSLFCFRFSRQNIQYS